MRAPDFSAGEKDGRRYGISMPDHEFVGASREASRRNAKWQEISALADRTRSSAYSPRWKTDRECRASIRAEDRKGKPSFFVATHSKSSGSLALARQLSAQRRKERVSSTGAPFEDSRAASFFLLPSSRHARNTRSAKGQELARFRKARRRSGTLRSRFVARHSLRDGISPQNTESCR